MVSIVTKIFRMVKRIVSNMLKIATKYVRIVTIMVSKHSNGI